MIGDSCRLDKGDCMTDVSKSAIVTDASRGIGTAIAEQLAHEGIAVAFLASSDEAWNNGQVIRANGDVI